MQVAGARAAAVGGDSGALGFGIVDSRSQYLHQLPLLGRLVRPRLQKGDWVRDEDLQARELTETLTILDAEGADGAFISEFAESLGDYAAVRPRQEPGHRRGGHPG